MNTVEKPGLTTVAHENVRLAWYEPGDGYRYSAVATRLPVAFMGGYPDSHRLVTVMGPFGDQSFVLEASHGALLTRSYLHGKLHDGISLTSFDPVLVSIAAVLPGVQVEGVDV